MTFLRYNGYIASMTRSGAFILILGIVSVFGFGMLAFEHAPRHAGAFPACPAAALQPATCPTTGGAGLSFHMNVFRTFAALPWLGAALLALAAFVLIAFLRTAATVPAQFSPKRLDRIRTDAYAAGNRAALRRWLAQKENGPNLPF